MDVLGIVFLLVVGLVVGSFLNVVIYRLNNGLSPLRGRSVCPKCKHQLVWRDNIPLVAFVLLKGKCRYCHSPISLQYPLIELATGILTILVFQLSNYELRITSFNLLITYALIAIFVSDLLYYTIPDEIVYPSMILAVIFHLRGGVAPQSNVAGAFDAPPAAHLGGVLLTALAAAGFFLLLVLVTHGKGMGMGDVKLAGLMGLALGWPKISVAILLAFLTGATVGVILILMGKKRLKSHIPFGPFLSAATLVALFL